MEDVTYPMHKGAKTALYIMCALMVVLCATAPLAIYFLYGYRHSRLRRASSS